MQELYLYAASGRFWLIFFAAYGIYKTTSAVFDTDKTGSTALFHYKGSHRAGGGCQAVLNGRQKPFPGHPPCLSGQYDRLVKTAQAEAFFIYGGSEKRLDMADVSLFCGGASKCDGIKRVCCVLHYNGNVFAGDGQAYISAVSAVGSEGFLEPGG